MRKSVFAMIGGASGLLILILDSKTAFTSACDGISLCISTVIPSLFPFFFLSILLNSCLTSQEWAFLRPLGRLLKIPAGSEGLLLMGLLGGYPIGAQNISQSHEAGTLSKSDASRMMAFCNNCGPAFIFGVIGQFFNSIWTVILLWMIHIMSALAVGMIIPGDPKKAEKNQNTLFTPSAALRRSISALAQVCGWVVLFRIVISFLERWFGFYLNGTSKVILSGILELTNGCTALQNIHNIGVRFIVCSGLISFGGICVTMQTMSVVSDKLNKRLYLPSNILQCSISVILATLVSSPMIKINFAVSILLIGVVSAVICTIILRKIQINSSNLLSGVV